MLRNFIKCYVFEESTNFGHNTNLRLSDFGCAWRYILIKNKHRFKTLSVGGVLIWITLELNEPALDELMWQSHTRDTWRWWRWPAEIWNFVTGIILYRCRFSSSLICLGSISKCRTPFYIPFWKFLVHLNVSR